MGMRNHEFVPVDLIQKISGIKTTNINRILSDLLKFKLIRHVTIKYSGYCLNFLGYDYLAINSLIKQGILVQICQKIGVGKESDVYLCYIKKTNNEINEEQVKQIKEEYFIDGEKVEEEKAGNKEDLEDSEDENEGINSSKSSSFHLPENDLPKSIVTKLGELTVACIKFARLGRVCFRSAKNKRDYTKKKTHYNWLYLSRLSATSEFKNLKGLFEGGFNVPMPYGWNRHAIIMEYVPCYPLNKLVSLLVGFLFKLLKRHSWRIYYRDISVVSTKAFLH